ncbi:hypothetical protein [Amycolatopsis orientalis]|uniref:hypothetical protein n=1 Tax=Amycolatopsis orientalis TaxID=31958 RepID=UPI00040B1F98|nr:hypothetical protein [Amycolatopsis orientalis]
MAIEVFEDGDELLCVQATRLDSDEAWIYQLSEARPAPSSWGGTSSAGAVLPGDALVTVTAYDPDVEKPPCVSFETGEVVTLTSLRRFLDRVTEHLADLRREW